MGPEVGRTVMLSDPGDAPAVYRAVKPDVGLPPVLFAQPRESEVPQAGSQERFLFAHASYPSAL